MYPSERIDDIIIKETSELISIPVSIVDAVYKFQWKTANEATKLFNTVELSDLGVFLCSSKRMSKKVVTLENVKQKYIEKANDMDLSEKKRNTNLKKIISIEESINYLKGKVK